MKDWTLHFDNRLWLLDNEMPIEQARFIKCALGLRKGGRVLDVPCGAGRTSLALAKLGLDVTGVELRAKFTNRAKRRFCREGLSGTFSVGDMRELDFDNKFDGVVNWFGSFGYFDDATNLDVLHRFARALRPGGRVLIHQSNRERMLRHFEKTTRSTMHEAKRRGPGEIVTRSRWNAKLERLEGTWTLELNGQRIDYPISRRFYTLAQFRTLLRRVGLVPENVYGGPPIGADYRRSSRVIVVVGRKPKSRDT